MKTYVYFWSNSERLWFSWLVSKRSRNINSNALPGILTLYNLIFPLIFVCDCFTKQYMFFRDHSSISSPQTGIIVVVLWPESFWFYDGVSFQIPYYTVLLSPNLLVFHSVWNRSQMFIFSGLSFRHQLLIWFSFISSFFFLFATVIKSASYFSILWIMNPSLTLWSLVITSITCITLFSSCCCRNYTLKSGKICFCNSYIFCPIGIL